MKRKRLMQGFTLGYASCNICAFEKSGNKRTSVFHLLKDTLTTELQDLHDADKPAACNGVLTISFLPAVKEYEK
jgi:hypothetical protein